MSHFPQTHLNAPFHASHPMLPPNPPHYSSTSGSPHSPFIPQLLLLLCCICIFFGVHQNSPWGSSAWLAVKHMLFIYIYTSLNQNFCAEEIKKKKAPFSQPTLERSAEEAAVIIWDSLSTKSFTILVLLHFMTLSIFLLPGANFCEGCLPGRNWLLHQVENVFLSSCCNASTHQVEGTHCCFCLNLSL